MCGPNSNFKDLNVPELWQLVLQMNVEREDFSGACEERKEKEMSVFDSLDNPILMKLGTRLHFFIFSHQSSLVKLMSVFFQLAKKCPFIHLF